MRKNFDSIVNNIPSRLHVVSTETEAGLNLTNSGLKPKVGCLTELLRHPTKNFFFLLIKQHMRSFFLSGNKIVLKNFIPRVKLDINSNFRLLCLLFLDFFFSILN